MPGCTRCGNVFTTPLKLRAHTCTGLAAEATVGLVCTLARCAHVLDSFVKHYLALGLTRLYLYFDDPADLGIELLAHQAHPQVQIIPRDDALTHAWRSCASWDTYQLLAGSEVQARQILNCEDAWKRATDDGVEWLLHVDSDELLHLPGPQFCSAPGFFGRLSSRGVNMYTFKNVEGVPESPFCVCLLYTSPSPRDRTRSRMPSSA
eukprot:TRINITY_DN34134_c0_g1_i1.p1 TRINITY_DN34134_c0_g1~~TRINITY_DN34134_c0_g1_i1.p1  ORF type:complete len:206 (-),score=21.93 TRINITY_DN34134_c0_g1_i1:52-669(-)